MIEFAAIAVTTVRLAAWLLLFIALLLAGPLLTLALGRIPIHGDWRTATRLYGSPARRDPTISLFLVA